MAESYAVNVMVPSTGSGTPQIAVPGELQELGQEIRMGAKHAIHSPKLLFALDTPAGVTWGGGGEQHLRMLGCPAEEDCAGSSPYPPW